MNNIIYDNHMSFTIEDQSIAQVTEVEVADDSLAFLFLVFSSRGKDNQIFEFRGPGAFKSFFGDDVDDFKKYGQANLNAMRALRSGSRVFGCRLLPDNAKRANVVFEVGVLANDAIPQWTRSDTVVSQDDVLVTLGVGPYTLDTNGDKIPIMVDDGAGGTEQLTLPGVDIKLVKTVIDSYDTNGIPIFNGLPHDVIDGTDTWTMYPLFMTYYYGKGKGGNSFGFKIEADTSRDRLVSDGRRYVLNVYEYLESGQVRSIFTEPIYFSFNPEALYSQDTDISEGLSYTYTNKLDNGNESPVQLVTYNDNFDTLTTVLFTHVDEGTSDDIDFIFARQENGSGYSKIIRVEASLDPENATVMLAGGTDGSLALGETIDVEGTPTVVTEQMVTDMRLDLLTKFFSCDIDNSVFDEKIVDADIITDANFPDTVKRTILTEMPKYRPDIALIMDLGLTTSYKDALTKASNITGYVDGDYDFMAYINGHSGFTKDVNIVTPRPVTYTYDFIGVISELFATPTGRFQMVAGATTGITKYVDWSWLAEKDKSNMILQLEKAKVNFIEKLNKRGQTMYSSETTLYDKEYSKLTSLRNALVIGDAQRVCHKTLIKYKYDPSSVSATISNATTDILTQFRGRYPATIGVGVSIYQTKRDKITDNAHCDITFTFPNILKRFTVTIIARREPIEEAA